jgi:hypothetical protein
MPTVVTNPSSASANSYCSVTEADSYADTVLNAGVWTAATTADKSRALIMATRLLDDLCEWKGIPTTDTQALKWPRRGVITQISASGDGVFFHQRTINVYGGLIDPIGVELPSDEIPQFLKNATAELGRMLLTSDRIDEQDSGNISSIEIPGLTIGYLGSGSSSKRKLLPPQVYHMIAFYIESMVGYTPRRIVRS